MEQKVAHVSIQSVDKPKLSSLNACRFNRGRGLNPIRSMVLWWVRRFGSLCAGKLAQRALRRRETTVRVECALQGAGLMLRPL